MKGSVIILLCFVLGVFLGYKDFLPAIVIDNDLTIYILGGLMFLVGVSVGYDKKMFDNLRRTRPKILLVPLCTILGTLLGTALVSFATKYDLFECMAVGSGFGYYSLSSVFIMEYKGAELGTVALISNIIREIFTLLFAPLLVLYFGKLAPIVSGGATTMDTTLPVVSRYSGSEFILIAILHGFVLDLCVPFLVTLFCHI